MRTSRVHLCMCYNSNDTVGLKEMYFDVTKRCPFVGWNSHFAVEAFGLYSRQH